MNETAVPMAAGESFRITVRDLLWVCFCIVIAALLRLDFMQAASFVIDADEAIVGLMGKHILEGRGVPVFYYGQHYMGSLEAILAAGVFALFGVSSFNLQLVALLCSLALLPVLFLLGREIGGRWTAWSATLLTAIPPAGLIVWSAKARGGFIEILLLGSVSLVVACRWLKGEPFSLRYAGLLGFLLGVGWWVNNQIVYFIIPISLFVALHLVAALLERGFFTRLPIVVCIGTAAFLLGGSPYWIYNLQRGFPSLGMFGFASLSEMIEHVEGLFTTALPILLGGKRFWDSSAEITGRTLLHYVFFASILLVVMWARRAELRRLLTGRIDPNTPVEMLTVFIVVSCGVFTASTFGWLVQAPRYLLPVYVGLFPLCGFGIERLKLACGPGIASGALCTFLLLALGSAYVPTRAVPGEPVVFNGERVDRDHEPLLSRLQELGIRRIRANYWIGYRVAFESNERVTCLLLQEPRQVRLPQYEDGVTPEERDRVPLVVVPAEAVLVKGALTSLGFSWKEEQVGAYTLFYALARDETKLRPIDSNLISATSTFTQNDPAHVLDGSLHTRWGTGVHQQPGQEIRLALHAPTLLRAVRIDMGAWGHDYARGLEVAVVLEDGTERLVLNRKEYGAIRYFAAENLEFHFLFAPVMTHQVIFRQTGNHPILDWSVAEVTLFAGVEDRTGSS